MMRPLHYVLPGALGVLLFAAQSQAGPERIDYPEGYAEKFVNYLDVDHVARKRVRKMYVSPEANEAAQAGAPLPDGTILIMEDHDAEVAADGAAEMDAEGRLVPQEAIGNIFVMAKNPEWETANGNWEYARFNADGSRPADASFEGCFSCHTSRVERDFTFTYWKFVSDRAR
ncbi:MAG: cytochrome P460 family protein [Propylenella sp.]